MAPENNKLGTIITTEDSPSISGFSFVIQADAGVKRGQFVSVKTTEGIGIATVANIFKTNRYFESAGSVKEYSKTSDIFTALPVTQLAILLPIKNRTTTPKTTAIIIGICPFLIF